MADTTTHDTVGASTLAVPYFSPASPTPDDHPPIDSPDRLPSPVSSPGARSPSGSPPGSREASLDRAARELDARLREYTVDFSHFPSGHGQDDALEEQPELGEEADRLSAVGGPEDFTANLERYLLGEDGSIDQEIDDEDKNSEQPLEDLQSEPELPQDEDDDLPERQGAQLHQPAVEAEIGEDSEFGPVDMSTPSHLLRRTAGPTRDVTHLEDIEEDPDDEPSLAATPTVRKQLKSPTNGETRDPNEDLRQQIAELTQAVKDRDEQLEESRKRVLEAASFGEEIKHLRTELQRKTALIEELEENHADRAKHRRSSVTASDFSALQKQIADMQKDLHSRNSHAEIDAERQETITILRQQLSLTQEQMRKRDAVLDETLAQLKQVTTAKEQQLHEKNAEVERLRGQLDNQRAEIERLETDVLRANREYRALEDQMVVLETKNQPLEERNSTLEADLNRAQSQVTAQENALKAIATDTSGGTYSEILELIKDLGQPNINRPFKPRDSGGDNSDQELEQIYDELAKLRTESSERAAANKSLETQLLRANDQAAESQLIIQSIEAENTRLIKQADDLKSTFDRTHGDFERLRTEHSKALETIERLQKIQQSQAQGRTQQQQPSPPSTPHTNVNSTTSSLEATHQAQIANLKTAHATAISTLRSAHADSTRKLRAILAASEKREADLRAELEQHEDQTRTQTHIQTTHRDEINAKDEEIASLNAEISRLHSIITSKDETAAAMDLRIAKSVEKREKEWERRVELLLKERERMGKALLWTWGEKENPGSRSGAGDKERDEKDRSKGKARGGSSGKIAVSESDKENLEEDVGRRRHGQGQAYRYKYVKRT